ncbi:EbsA family protein [Ligilactobacillus aviarius]|uniref:EbsA family protein n=1 Tax=Ligilactobacillus aviarius TaxID=1606 RepID=UPI0024BAAAEA|nr:EbsA family protein [Ligilactobacillus aviarius]
MKQKRYYSQPDVPTSIVCWSFTWMIFLFSMLLWLEITVFQIWTLMTLILFLIVALVELRGRYLQIEDGKINYHTLIVFNGQSIKLSDIKEVKHNRWGVVRFVTEKATHSFLMMPKTATRLAADVAELIK